MIQLVSVRARKDWEKSRAIAIKLNEKLMKNFVDSLPFKLTDAQRKSAFQILKDIEKPHPDEPASRRRRGIRKNGCGCYRGA